MNHLKKSDSEDAKKYRRLKRYWSLFFKDSNQLDTEKCSYNRLFKRPLCQKDIMDELLTYHPLLKQAYDEMHLLKYAILCKNSELFFDLIDQLPKSLPDTDFL